MNTTTALRNELTTIRAALATHRARISEIVDAAHAIELNAYDTMGIEVRDAAELFPAWTEMKATIESMNEQDGYFWAMSRERDLASALEGGRFAVPSTLEGCDFHVVGIGDMPRADASVGPWICAVFGFALAA